MQLTERPRIHDFTGQVVLITGIGCQDEGWGNGIATAALLARQGAKIFGCDLVISAAEISKKRILAHVPTPTFVDACMKRHKRIDCVVNNVGRSEKGDPATTSEETWTKQIDINLKSVYLTTHLVLPIMECQEAGGNVVNVSSVAGLRSIAKPQVGYAAAKAAIIQLTRVTAVMYAAKDIRLNTVVPGLIDTPLCEETGGQICWRRL